MRYDIPLAPTLPSIRSLPQRPLQVQPFIYEVEPIESEDPRVRAALLRQRKAEQGRLGLVGGFFETVGRIDAPIAALTHERFQEAVRQGADPNFGTWGLAFSQAMFDTASSPAGIPMLALQGAMLGTAVPVIGTGIGAAVGAGVGVGLNLISLASNPENWSRNWETMLKGWKGEIRAGTMPIDFVATLEEAGVSRPLAMIGGIALSFANPLDPLNYIGIPIKAAGKLPLSLVRRELGGGRFVGAATSELAEGAAVGARRARLIAEAGAVEQAVKWEDKFGLIDGIELSETGTRRIDEAKHALLQTRIKAIGYESVSEFQDVLRAAGTPMKDAKSLDELNTALASFLEKTKKAGTEFEYLREFEPAGKAYVQFHSELLDAVDIWDAGGRKAIKLRRAKAAHELAQSDETFKELARLVKTSPERAGDFTAYRNAVENLADPNAAFRRIAEATENPGAISATRSLRDNAQLAYNIPPPGAMAGAMAGGAALGIPFGPTGALVGGLGGLVVGAMAGRRLPGILGAGVNLPIGMAKFGYKWRVAMYGMTGLGYGAISIDPEDTPLDAFKKLLFFGGFGAVMGGRWFKRINQSAARTYVAWKNGVQPTAADEAMMQAGFLQHYGGQSIRAIAKSGIILYGAVNGAIRFGKERISGVAGTLDPAHEPLMRHVNQLLRDLMATDIKKQLVAQAAIADIARVWKMAKDAGIEIDAARLRVLVVDILERKFTVLEDVVRRVQRTPLGSEPAADVTPETMQAARAVVEPEKVAAEEARAEEVKPTEEYPTEHAPEELTPQEEATLVEEAVQLAKEEEVAVEAAKPKPATREDLVENILGGMEDTPKTVNEIKAITGVSTQRNTALLKRMVAEGQIRQLPDGRYERVVEEPPIVPVYRPSPEVAATAPMDFGTAATSVAGTGKAVLDDLRGRLVLANILGWKDGAVEVEGGQLLREAQIREIWDAEGNAVWMRGAFEEGVPQARTAVEGVEEGVTLAPVTEAAPVAEAVARAPAWSKTPEEIARLNENPQVGPLIIGRATAVKIPDGPTLPGGYALMSVEDIIPSHGLLREGQFELNSNATPGGGYPYGFNPNGTLQNANRTRDYSNDPVFQAQLRSNFSQPLGTKEAFDPEEVTAITPSPNLGAPVVALVHGRYVVLAGNSRAIRLQRLYGSDVAPEYRAAYVQAIQQKASLTSINPSEIAQIPDPVLVRIVQDAPQEYGRLVKLMDAMNQGEMAAAPALDVMGARTAALTPEQRETLTKIMNDLPEEGSLIRNLQQSSPTNRALAGFLAETGIVGERELRALFDAEGNFTAAGARRVEDLLMSLVLEDPAAQELARQYSRMALGLMKSAPDILRIAQVDANFLPDFYAAARAYTEFVESGAKWGDFVTQLRTSTGRTALEELEPRQRTLFTFIHENKTSSARWRDVMARYADELHGTTPEAANLQIPGMEAMRAETRSTDEVFRQVFEERIGGVEEPRAPLTLLQPAKGRARENFEENLRVAVTREGRGAYARALQEAVVRGEIRVRSAEEAPNVVQAYMTISDAIGRAMVRLRPDRFDSLDDWYRIRTLAFTPSVSVRGALTTLDDTNLVITLFKDADVSTLLHEEAHILRQFLTEEEMGTLFKTYRTKKLEVMEERFAQDFERYLATERAPTRELESVFARIKEWLQDIYRAAKAVLEGEVNPSVRMIFDKYLEPEGVEAVRQPTAELAFPEEWGNLSRIVRGYARAYEVTPDQAFARLTAGYPEDMEWLKTYATEHGYGGAEIYYLLTGHPSVVTPLTKAWGTPPEDFMRPDRGTYTGYRGARPLVSGMTYGSVYVAQDPRFASKFAEKGKYGREGAVLQRVTVETTKPLIANNPEAWASLAVAKYVETKASPEVVSELYRLGVLEPMPYDEIGRIAEEVKILDGKAERAAEIVSTYLKRYQEEVEAKKESIRRIQRVLGRINDGANLNVEERALLSDVFPDVLRDYDIRQGVYSRYRNEMAEKGTTDEDLGGADQLLSESMTAASNQVSRQQYDLENLETDIYADGMDAWWTEGIVRVSPLFFPDEVAAVRDLWWITMSTAREYSTQGIWGLSAKQHAWLRKNGYDAIIEPYDNPTHTSGPAILALHPDQVRYDGGLTYSMQRLGEAIANGELIPDAVLNEYRNYLSPEEIRLIETTRREWEERVVRSLAHVLNQQDEAATIKRGLGVQEGRTLLQSRLEDVAQVIENEVRHHQQNGDRRPAYEVAQDVTDDIIRLAISKVTGVSPNADNIESLSLLSDTIERLGFGQDFEEMSKVALDELGLLPDKSNVLLGVLALPIALSSGYRAIHFQEQFAGMRTSELVSKYLNYHHHLFDRRARQTLSKLGVLDRKEEQTERTRLKVDEITTAVPASTLRQRRMQFYIALAELVRLNDLGEPTGLMIPEVFRSITDDLVEALHAEERTTKTTARGFLEQSDQELYDQLGIRLEDDAETLMANDDYFKERRGTLTIGGQEYVVFARPFGEVPMTLTNRLYREGGLRMEKIPGGMRRITFEQYKQHYFKDAEIVRVKSALGEPLFVEDFNIALAARWAQSRKAVLKSDLLDYAVSSGYGVPAMTSHPNSWAEHLAFIRGEVATDPKVLDAIRKEYALAHAGGDVYFVAKRPKKLATASDTVPELFELFDTRDWSGVEDAEVAARLGIAESDVPNFLNADRTSKPHAFVHTDRVNGVQKVWEAWGGGDQWTRADRRLRPDQLQDTLSFRMTRDILNNVDESGWQRVEGAYRALRMRTSAIRTPEAARLLNHATEMYASDLTKYKGIYNYFRRAKDEYLTATSADGKYQYKWAEAWEKARADTMEEYGGTTTQNAGALVWAGLEFFTSLFARLTINGFPAVRVRDLFGNFIAMGLRGFGFFTPGFMDSVFDAMHVLRGNDARIDVRGIEENAETTLRGATNVGVAKIESFAGMVNDDSFGRAYQTEMRERAIHDPKAYRKKVLFGVETSPTGEHRFTGMSPGTAMLFRNVLLPAATGAGAGYALETGTPEERLEAALKGAGIGAGIGGAFGLSRLTVTAIPSKAGGKQFALGDLDYRNRDLIQPYRGSDSGWSYWLRRVFNAGEDVQRLAFWLHLRRQGFNDTDAARTVHETLFNPISVPPGLMQFRPMMPFFRWTAFNLPFTARAVTENPRAILRVAKGINALQSNAADVDNRFTSSWILGQPHILWAHDEDKNIAHYYVLGTWIPQADLLSLLDPSNRERFITTLLSPVLTTGIEMAQNSSFYTGKKIDPLMAKGVERPLQVERWLGVDVHSKTRATFEKFFRLLREIDRISNGDPYRFLESRAQEEERMGREVERGYEETPSWSTITLFDNARSSAFGFMPRTYKVSLDREMRIVARRVGSMREEIVPAIRNAAKWKTNVATSRKQLMQIFEALEVPPQGRETSFMDFLTEEGIENLLAEREVLKEGAREER